MNKKNSIFIIIIALIGSVLYYKNFQKTTIDIKSANDLSTWKTYEIANSQYKINYPPFLHPDTRKPIEGYQGATFVNDDKTIFIGVSNVPTGFEEDWKSCAPSEQITALDSLLFIQYLCNGNNYRIVAGTSAKFYIIAGLNEKDFTDSVVKNVFKNMVSSFTVK